MISKEALMSRKISIEPFYFLAAMEPHDRIGFIHRDSAWLVQIFPALT